MGSHASFFSASGRIAPGPFVWRTLLVYVLSFLSQFLLASPITARASFVPFLAVQIVLGWAWYALHVRRLRDAGRPTGSALALTILYALAIVLLLLVMVVAYGMTGPTETGGLPVAGILGVLVFVFLASMVVGTAAFSTVGYTLLTALVLIALPVLIAIVFSIWLAGRPSVAAPSAVPTQP